MTDWREQLRPLARTDVDWWATYNAYLESEEWTTRRQHVLERAGGICEGCRDARATQVHHLTYKHVGRELLWELAAVCNDCHEALHPHMTATTSFAERWEQAGRNGR